MTDLSDLNTPPVLLHALRDAIAGVANTIRIRHRRNLRPDGDSYEPRRRKGGRKRGKQRPLGRRLRQSEADALIRLSDLVGEGVTRGAADIVDKQLEFHIPQSRASRFSSPVQEVMAQRSGRKIWTVRGDTN